MFELFTLIPLDITTSVLPMDAKPIDEVVKDLAGDVDTAFQTIIIVGITIVVAVVSFKRGFSFAGMISTVCAAAFAIWLLMFGGLVTLGATLGAWMDIVTKPGS